MSPADVDAIRSVDGVAAADGLTRARAGLWSGGDVTPTVIESLPAQEFRWQRLSDGRFPGSGTEVALGASTMDTHGLELGDVVTMATSEGGDGQFTVVGRVDTRGALDYESTAYAVVTPELAQAFAGTDGANEVRVALADGAAAGSVIDAVNAEVPGGWPETTGALVAATEDLYGIGLGMLSALIDVFALVTALVAVTVLGTVVWSSLPGRRRQLALMRLVGASRTQITCVLLLESAVIALVGGLLALPVGVGLAYLALPALGAIPGVPAIPWSQLTVPSTTLVAVPVGAVVCAVLAVMVPAVSAGRVPPADALRRSAGAERSRPVTTALRLGAVVVMALVVLAAPMVGGARVAVVAAALFLLALILSVPALCRVGAALAERVIGARRPLAEIGAVAIRAFPGRTAATGMAAMLAAMMMALCWVTLSSVTAIADARTSDDPGPQLMVGAYSGQDAINPVVAEALAGVDGVDGTVAVSIGEVSLSGSSTRMIKDVAFGDAAEFAELTAGRFPLESMEGDAIYLPASDQVPFRDGSRVVISGPDGERSLTVHYVEDLPLPGLVHPDVAEDLGIGTAPSAVWLALTAGADRAGGRADVLDSVRTVATIGGDLPVTGTAVTDARIDSLVRTAQRAAAAMLLVAVVIAVLGAVVTLSTSLRERAGEFAVLRLLGMEGAQLRRLAGAEAVTVGAVSVVIGLAAGTLLGCVTATVVADLLGVATHLAVPVAALAAMGVLTVAGLRMAVTGPVDNVSLVPPAAALRDANLGGTP